MEHIFKSGWTSGLPKTVCGSGSTLKNTVSIAESIKQIIKMYGIKSINDAGCGDMLWVKKYGIIDLVDYQGYDLVPRNKDVISIDITQEKMQDADLIICRDVLFHLPNVLVFKALEMFRRTGAMLLISTQPGADNTLRSDSPSVTASNLDLEATPFNMVEPKMYVKDCLTRVMGFWI